MICTLWDVARQQLQCRKCTCSLAIGVRVQQAVLLGYWKSRGQVQELRGPSFPSSNSSSVGSIWWCCWSMFTELQLFFVWFWFVFKGFSSPRRTVSRAAVNTGEVQSPSSTVRALTAHAGSKTGFRSHSMQTLGHCASCFILQSRRVETSDWSLMGRMHMPFEWAAKPCQALQTREDAGTTQTVEVKKQKPSQASVHPGAHEAEDKVKLWGRTQCAGYVLVSTMLEVTLWPFCPSSSIVCHSGKAGWGYPGQSKHLCLRMLCQPALDLHPPGRSGVTKWLVTACSFITWETWGTT